MLTFEDIRPYNDQEAVKALRKVAANPLMWGVSRYLFPQENIFYLSSLLKKVKGVDDFQASIMSKVVKSIIDKTTDGIFVEGVENLKEIRGKYLIMSNHRDIVLDPALLQYVLFINKLPLTELCVGSNLLSRPVVKDLMRSNRMIKVMRGQAARDTYFSSSVLSEYIRKQISEGFSSVWIAQKEGRSKNGLDLTGRAVLKMLDMSGSSKDFIENWKELKIVPMSISYQYESCDALKAKELLISRDRKYVKKRGEDLNSIITGIRQKKGKVYISFDKPLGLQELELASQEKANARYRKLASIIDSHIRGNFHLFDNNYIAHDMLSGEKTYSNNYTPEAYENFASYMEGQLSKLDKSLDREELRKIFLEIYANPLRSAD